jgi:DNA-binding transcriptional regulator YiaG
MITGAQILAAREKLGESQATFAARLKTSQPTIHRWETKGPPKRGAGRYAVERLIAELNLNEAA